MFSVIASLYVFCCVLIQLSYEKLNETNSSLVERERERVLKSLREKQLYSCTYSHSHTWTARMDVTSDVVEPTGPHRRVEVVEVMCGFIGSAVVASQTHLFIPQSCSCSSGFNCSTHLLMGHNFNPVLLYWSSFSSSSLFICLNLPGTLVHC